MDDLEAKFSRLLTWERRKRREQTLISVSCYAAALAIILSPFHIYLPNPWLRWLVPAALFFTLAPWFLYRARWRLGDSARALVNLDKTLGLEERAVTAWELSTRKETQGAALLVLRQAEEKLRALDPRAVSPRRWSWPAYVALPLLALWFTLLWFDFDRSEEQARYGAPPTLAHRLREYSRELQEKAKSEGLRETLKLGRELEKTAQKNIETKNADESLKKELASAAGRFAAAAKSSAEKNSFSSGESEQSLKDLKAEIEATRDMLQPEPAQANQETGQRWMERLAAMPQLKRQFENSEGGGQGLGQKELKSFLDKLEQQVTGELDRRSLIDAQQYLEQLMKQGQGAKGENYARSGAPGEQDPSAEGAREKNPNSLPGKEPGKQDQDSRSLPELRPGASTQVKGLLGEGESSALDFKGKPTAGKSAVPQAEITASYRRQAEQELNSERVPDALKETIRNYFLSLGEVKSK
jgi:hypothetical protein